MWIIYIGLLTKVENINIKFEEVMPIYEYKCKNCGKYLEVRQKISDEPLRECPNCSENALEKQWSLSGFQFKGSGWYISDYTNRGKEAKSENGSSTAADKTPASNTETKNSASGGESTANATSASNTETKTSAVKD